MGKGCGQAINNTECAKCSSRGKRKQEILMVPNYMQMHNCTSNKRPVN